MALFAQVMSTQVRHRQQGVSPNWEQSIPTLQICCNGKHEGPTRKPKSLIFSLFRQSFLVGAISFAYHLSLSMSQCHNLLLLATWMDPTSISHSYFHHVLVLYFCLYICNYPSQGPTFGSRIIDKIKRDIVRILLILCLLVRLIN